MIDRATIALDPARIYTAREVAAWLQHPVEWFYRHRARLERTRGFPQSLSTGWPRWSGEVLIRWAASAHLYEAQARAGRPRGGNVLDLRTEAMRLEAQRRPGASSAR